MRMSHRVISVLMLEPKEVISALSIKQIAELCQVDLTTARRWKRRAICPPRHALEFLAAKVNGDLSFLDPAWRGWVLRDGHLWSPENWCISMSGVLASRLHEAQLAAWRREVRIIKAKLEEIERGGYIDQPLPDEWEVEILAG